jgi:hypothetical protein
MVMMQADFMRFSRLPRGLWVLSRAWPGDAGPQGRWRRRAWIAAGAVLLLPIVLAVLILLALAAVTFVLVVLIGRMVTSITGLFSGPGGGGDAFGDSGDSGGGRRNVTVIRRDL